MNQIDDRGEAGANLNRRGTPRRLSAIKATARISEILKPVRVMTKRTQRLQRPLLSADRPLLAEGADDVEGAVGAGSAEGVERHIPPLRDAPPSDEERQLGGQVAEAKVEAGRIALKPLPYWGGPALVAVTLLFLAVAVAVIRYNVRETTVAGSAGEVRYFVAFVVPAGACLGVLLHYIWWESMRRIRASAWFIDREFARRTCIKGSDLDDLFSGRRRPPGFTRRGGVWVLELDREKSDVVESIVRDNKDHANRTRLMSLETFAVVLSFCCMLSLAVVVLDVAVLHIQASPLPPVPSAPSPPPSPHSPQELARHPYLAWVRDMASIAPLLCVLGMMSLCGLRGVVAPNPPPPTTSQPMQSLAQPDVRPDAVPNAMRTCPGQRILVYIAVALALLGVVSMIVSIGVGAGAFAILAPRS